MAIYFEKHAHEKINTIRLSYQQNLLSDYIKVLIVNGQSEASKKLIRQSIVELQHGFGSF